MGFFLSNKVSLSSSFTNIYKNVSPSELESVVEKLFQSEGYNRDSTSQEIIFIKGNRIKRLLLGAFAKYFKFKVMIIPEGENYSVLVSSVSTGMSGGIIGVNQIKHETNRLNYLLQNI